MLGDERPIRNSKEFYDYVIIHYITYILPTVSLNKYKVSPGRSAMIKVLPAPVPAPSSSKRLWALWPKRDLRKNINIHYRDP